MEDLAMSDEYNNQANYAMDEYEDYGDTQSVDATEDVQKYLTFVSDGLNFAIKAAYVSEIITNHHITVLPMVPSYVKGIINLRGQIIPILDIREKMNKPPMEVTDASCIIVLDINSISIGIFVDAVSQVVDVNEKEISPMPSNSPQELVNGMMTIGKDTVLFLDCELLIQN
jgi:purine-binding chemotaxis protein CheW